MKINKFSPIILLAGLCFTACKSKADKDVKLPAASEAQFTYNTLNGDVNTYVFESTTPGAFITNWDFAGTKSKQLKDTIFFARKGSYVVSLNTASKGGSSAKTITIDIPTTSPLAADFSSRDISDVTHPNRYEVSVVTPNVLPANASFIFSNGTSSIGQLVDTVYFPFAGENAVTVSLNLNGAVDQFTKNINVSTTDMTNQDFTDPILVNITGGLNAVDGKTWVFNTDPAKTWVGPGDNVPVNKAYYAYPDGIKSDPFKNGMSNNEYTFKMQNFQYIPKNKNVTCSGQFSDVFFNHPDRWDESKTDPAANGTYNTFNEVDPKHIQAPFVWKKDDWSFIKDQVQTNTTGRTMQISNNSYIGWFANFNKYIIVKSTTDTLQIGVYASDNALDPPTGFANIRVFTLTAKK